MKQEWRRRRRRRRERILVEKEVKTNMPRTWAPPRALKDFEGANSFNWT